MNSDLQTQTSQEEVEMALQLDHQDYNNHPLHTHQGYTSQVIPRPPLTSSSHHRNSEKYPRLVCELNFSPDTGTFCRDFPGQSCSSSW